MQPDVGRLRPRAQRGPGTRGDAGGIPESRTIAKVREEQTARRENSRHLTQPLHGGERGWDLPVDIRIKNDEIRTGRGQSGNSLFAAQRPHPDPVAARQGELAAHRLGQGDVRLEHDLR